MGRIIGIPLDKIGAVEAYSIPSRDIYTIALDRNYTYWKNEGIDFIDNKEPKSYYTNRGIPGDTLNEVFQAGVFVSSPQYHKEVFEYIYNKYEDEHGAEWNYEMPAMSYELIKAGIVHWISPAFNFSVPDIMSAFYPDVWLKGQTVSKSKMIRRFRRIFHSKNKELIKNLNNVHSLSIFTHFSGCTSLMKSLHV